MDAVICYKYTMFAAYPSMNSSIVDNCLNQIAWSLRSDSLQNLYEKSRRRETPAIRREQAYAWCLQSFHPVFKAGMIV